MPAVVRAMIWPSATAHADLSASASPKRPWVPTCAKKIARAKAEKQAMPWVCGDPDEIHGMARKEGRSMQAASAAGHGRAYQIRQSEENCA